MSVPGLIDDQNLFEKSKILIVDDSFIVRNIVCDYLKEFGFKGENLIEAENGREAFEKLKQAGLVNLIISDLYMPQADGIEFLKLIRDDGGLKSIPFIMLTSETKDEKLDEAMKMGASGYIVKPFNDTDFKETIIKILSFLKNK